MKKWTTKSGIIVTRLNGIRCNCFIIEAENEKWLIDTSTLAEKYKITKQIEMIGVESLDGIILTHSHINHVESVSWFAQNFQCPVYVHDSELHFVQTGDCLIPKAARKNLEFVEKIVSFIPFLNKYPACREAQAIPFDEPLFKNKNIRILETPGHSEGSVSIIVDDEIAIVGDVMRRKSKFTVYFPWANQPGLIEISWKKLLQEGCQLFLPSHGKEIPAKMVEKALE